MKEDSETKIREAWKAHHQGDHQGAVDRFLSLVRDEPEHIDLYWGLALSYRQLGDRNNALQMFQRAKELVETRLQSEPEDQERYVMLLRMVDQQINQIENFVSQAIR